MRKVLRRSLTALAVVAVALLALVLWYRSASAPVIDATVHVAGLSDSVTVVRDAEGIPHIFAKQPLDAYFALGYVHAQDRLWQMEMNRRVAAGRLAEVLGKAALPTDRFLRTLGIRRVAHEKYLRLDSATRATLDAYAAGVNAYLAQRPGPLPIEFQLTRAAAPEPWTPEDSIGWVTMMAWDLSGNWGTELMRMRLAQRLDKKQIDEFLPPYPGFDGKPDLPLATADYTVLYRQLHATADALQAASEAAPEGIVPGKGSNNWVVGGARSVTGKPLLANDPHLGLGVPSLWYFAHLEAPGLKVIGATLPGVPCIVLGRTDRIAWGFTNTGPDTQDLYIEEIKDGQARTPDGWQQLETREEVLKVRGEPDEHMTVRVSRHGPLISDASPAGKDALDLVGQRYAIAFQWTALSPDDQTLKGGLKFATAHDWDSFLDAARDFDVPEQNIVYADVDGNIGYIAPGKVPVRAPDNDLMGQAPAPGWLARYDWVGFVPFDDLPRAFNPPAGVIFTANQKVVGADYKPFLTAEWEAPYRARRIAQLLDATPRHSVPSFEAMQADEYSVAAADLLPLLLETAPSNDAARRALELLGHWDGTMAMDRAEPAIYNAWVRELTRLVYADELGPKLFKDYFNRRPVFLANVLRDIDGQKRWCDNIDTPAVETCAELKTRALDLALADLTRRLGSDASRWRWGALHPSHSEHRPFSQVPILNSIFDLQAPIGGDSYTLDVAGYSIKDDAHPFDATHGPSLRAIYDFSDLERSEFIHSTGQSGDRLSPLYANFNARWRAVHYVPMQMDRASVERGALGTLILLP